MILDLQNSIDQVIIKLWPEVGPSPYYPCPNPLLGDLSTDVLFSVSKSIKQSPERLGALFTVEVPSNLKRYILIERGFINIKFEVTSDLIDSYYPVRISPTKIAIITACNELVSQSTKLRIQAASSLHALLSNMLGQEYELLEYNNYEEAKEVALAKGGFIWSVPGVIKGEDLSDELKDLRSSNVNLVMPDPSWCFDIDKPPPMISSTEVCSNNNFRYYLSSNAIGSDIDWSVPYLNERSNIWAFAKSTGERLSRFDFKSLNRTKIDESEEIKSLIKRKYLLKAVQARTLQTGFVWNYITYLQGLLLDINLMLNNPQARRDIEAGSLTNFEARLFSTLGEVIVLM